MSKNIMYNKGFRKDLRNDISCIEQLGYEIKDGTDIKVVTDTKNTYHIIMPYNDIDVSGVAAGYIGTYNPNATHGLGYCNNGQPLPYAAPKNNYHHCFCD